MRKILLISMLFVSVAKAQSINDTAMVYLEYYIKKDGIVVQKISPCIVIYEVVKHPTLEMPYMPHSDDRITSYTASGSYREYMVVKILLDGKPFDLNRTHRIIENP